MTETSPRPDDPRILIVDDEEANVSLLERILSKAQYKNVRSTTDSKAAMPLFEEFKPDLVLLDLNMPAPTGFQILGSIARALPEDAYLPVLVLTADVSKETRTAALAAGAQDFLTKPLDQIEVILRIRNLLRTRVLHLALAEHRNRLETAVAERTSELRATVSRLHESQQQLIQQERLRALGVMAGGVVHDFNNVLSVILGFGELLLEEGQNSNWSAGAIDSAQSIVTAALDASEMINRLREFQRPSDRDDLQVPVQLGELLQQAITLTQPRWKTQSAGAGLVIKVEAELNDAPPVLGNPAELREVMTNLIFNAVDAMPSGGTITLRLASEGEHVLVEIADTGMGMTDEVKARCLEPYFTTKGEGGTGLGLAMVYGIIERHRGTLQVDSEVGRGTSFTIRLPAIAELPEQAAVEATRLYAGCSILLAEDQAPLRQLLVRHLARFCTHLDVAADGREALAKVRERPYDVLITDQAMPHATGEQVALVVKALHPQTKIILLTGFGAQSSSAPVGVDLVLGKPISPAMIESSILQVLNGSSELRV